MIAVLLVVVGPTGRYHQAPKVKPEAATAVVELLMMGVRTPETCWAVNKCQIINWRNCCNWLIYLNCLHFFCQSYYPIMTLLWKKIQVLKEYFNSGTT
jgi:hypothetical protein